MAVDKSATEAAFRAAADKRAALEARLTEEQRVRYLALRQKLEVDLKRQEHRLAQRRHDYENEVRKYGIAPSLDMIPRPQHTPRAARRGAGIRIAAPMGGRSEESAGVRVRQIP